MQRTVHRLALTLALAPSLALAQANPKTRPASRATVKDAGKPATRTDSIRAVLDSGALARAYNPVLLNYLLEEGRPRLPKEQQRQAVDQLVTRFKQEMDVRPDEQAVASAAALAGILLGGSSGQGIAQGSFQVWNGWVDAALLLGRAGYKREVIPFFENCMASYPYDGLREKCAMGLTAADAERAYEVLIELEKKPGDEKRAALRLLGYLAGQPGVPKARHDLIVDTLIDRTHGFLNAVFSTAAIDGLVFAKDPRAIEPLRKMTKGVSRAEEVERAAKRALLIGFKDESLVPALEKDAKGGFGKEDDDRFFAAALLIEGGYEPGFAWARDQLTRKKGGLLKLKKGDGDMLGDLVHVLVHRGGQASIPVLQAALPVRKPEEWLSAQIAIGLLDLGDPAGLAVARLALENEKWLGTRLEAAEGLAAHGDLSGLPVLRLLTQDKGLFKKAADLARSRYRDPDDVKVAVAGSLADMDRPENVDLLKELLADDSDEVRTAAAFALGRMRNPRAIEGLSQGLAVDYGKEGNRPRSPEVRAHLLRMAVLRFAGREETRGMLARASQSEDPSVRFLALVAARS